MECGGRIPRCTARVSPAWSGSHWGHLYLCNATPLFHELFAKSAGFCRRRGPCGRHSEPQKCGRDSIFVSLRRGSSRSLNCRLSFSPSATLLIRMAESSQMIMLDRFEIILRKSGPKNPGKCPRPVRDLLFSMPDQGKS